MTADSVTHMEPDRKRREVAALLHEHGGLIYALGLRLTGDPSRAEDLVQETFLLAYRKWDQFRGESRASTWLYTIAVRRHVRMNRKRAGEPKRSLSLEEMLPFDPKEAVPDVPGDINTPLQEVLRTEALGQLEEAIVELASEYRVPLVLKEIIGFSVREVADVLGLTEATVKTRLHRARNMLFRTVSSVLPQQEVPPPAYTRRVCMDLLRAKHESLDRGVAFPVPPGEFCARCRAVFEAMDFAQGLCGRLAEAKLPEKVREAVLEDLAKEG